MMITFLKNKNHVSHTLFFRLLKLQLKKSEPASRNLILEGEKAYSRRARRETYLSERDLQLVRPLNRKPEDGQDHALTWATQTHLPAATKSRCPTDGPGSL